MRNTEYSKTSLNAGIYTTEIGIKPLCYLRNGLYVPVDCAVKDRPAHSDYAHGIDEAKYKSGHNSVTNGAGIHIEYNGVWVYLRPGTKCATTAVFDDNKTTHDVSAWHAGVTWEIYTVPEGIRHRFLLPIGFSTNLSMKVKSNGTLTQSGNTYKFGEICFELPHVYDENNKLNANPCVHTLTSNGGTNYTYLISSINTLGMLSPCLE